MLMFEPNKDLMHNYSGMGLGGATGLGIDPFITNKQVVFMGDSTFFHSGQLAISNSIKNGQDITYVILDNKTTAMTGQQTTPRSSTICSATRLSCSGSRRSSRRWSRTSGRGHSHQSGPPRRLPQRCSNRPC